jgi:hypothetical protein
MSKTIRIRNPQGGGWLTVKLLDSEEILMSGRIVRGVRVQIENGTFTLVEAEDVHPDDFECLFAKSKD